MQLHLKQLRIPPGQRVYLGELSWNMFQQALEELGDTRGSRLAYRKGVLEIMSPLLEHEDDKDIIGDFIKILLEEQDIEFRNAGSTTFKRDDLATAVEPDQCFYIEHEAMIRGKQRIDLSIDPPPDLVLEIDITANTRMDIYEMLGVPEAWRFDGSTLHIYVLNAGHYQIVESSRQFPAFDVRAVVPRYLEQSRVQGRNRTMRGFRQWVRETLARSAHTVL